MARSRISSAIPIDKMAKEIVDAMSEYSQDVAEASRKAVAEATAEAVLDLKRNSPKDTGRYARSWKYSAVQETKSVFRNIVHNAKYYRLTHLLEHGHANARGGGRTPAHPHIGLAEQKAIENLEEKMRQYINDVD